MMTTGGYLFGLAITIGVLAFLAVVRLAGLGISRLARRARAKPPRPRRDQSRVIG